MKIYRIESRGNRDFAAELPVISDSSSAISVRLPSGRTARLDRLELMMRGHAWHQPTRRVYYTRAGVLLLREQRAEIHAERVRLARKAKKQAKRRHLSEVNE